MSTGVTVFHEVDKVSLVRQNLDKRPDEYTGSLIFANIWRESIPDENNTKYLRKEIVRHV